MESILNKRQFFILSENAKCIIVFAICLLCIGLFGYTAYSKIVDFKVFRQGIHKLAFIGGYADVVAWLIPAVELLICLALIVPKFRKLGLVAFVTLMMTFTIYILGLMILGYKLPCYCGAAIEKLTWPQHIWFNILFIVLAVSAVFISQTQKNNEKQEGY